MVALREAATRAINEKYNAIAASNIHRDASHSWKRVTAASVNAGGIAPAEFSAEADMLSMSVEDFAALIASKPNAAAQRELERQRELRAIAAATTPDELPILG
jgi:hypothetical protein